MAVLITHNFGGLELSPATRARRASEQELARMEESKEVKSNYFYIWLDKLETSPSPLTQDGFIEPSTSPTN